jgi:hypothetical protein
MSLRKSDAPVALLLCLGLALAFAHFRSAQRPVEEAASSPLKPAAVPAGLPALEAAPAAAPRSSALEIAKKFGPSIGPSPIPIAARHVKPPAPPRKAEWLRSIGAFEDLAGIRWLFIKDGKSGRVIKLRSDGIATESGKVIDASGPEPLIELDSIAYSIRGR